MSADNTIVILRTPNSPPSNLPSNLYEYRVIHAQAVENLYWDPKLPDNHNENGNPRYVVSYFRNAPVFNNNTEALKFADKMHDEIGFVEYGIERINFPCSFNWYVQKAKELRREELITGRWEDKCVKIDGVCVGGKFTEENTFSWGNNEPNCERLARFILVEALRDIYPNTSEEHINQRAMEFQQQFKEDIIAHLPENKNFILKFGTIEDWIEKNMYDSFQPDIAQPPQPAQPSYPYMGDILMEF